MNRDSRWLWVFMASGIITQVSSRMDVLDRIVPATMTDFTHAIIELLAIVVTAVSGVLIASPLKNISERGRRKYLRERVNMDRR